MPFKKKKHDVGTYSLVIAAFAVAGVASAVVLGGERLSADLLDGVLAGQEDPYMEPGAPAMDAGQVQARVDELTGQITGLIAEARESYAACTADFEQRLSQIQVLHAELQGAEQLRASAQPATTAAPEATRQGPPAPPPAPSPSEPPARDVPGGQAGAAGQAAGCFNYQWGLATEVHFQNYCSPNGACPPGKVEFSPENTTCLNGQDCAKTDKGQCDGGSCIWCVDAGVCGNAILEEGEECEDTSAASTADHPWNCPAGQRCGVKEGLCKCLTM